MNAQPQTQPATARGAVRLGFLGLGWIGRKRLDAIASDSRVDVAALADMDATRLRAAQLAYPEAILAPDLAALLDAGVDAVVIATPNSCHASQAVACFEAGVPVFCQKPLAIDAADTRRVLEAASRADRLLGVDYSYRHVHGMAELKQRIADAELGQILAIDLRFHNAYGPDKAWCLDRRIAGGGCLLDLGVHLVDLALWLQDSPVMNVVGSRLFANGRPFVSRCLERDIRDSGAAELSEQGVEDLAFAELMQQNGALVRITCSWNAQIGRDADIGMDIFGARGGASWRNVGGSFYDFELDICHGTHAERIGTYPDDWGGRALSAWVSRLWLDRSFNAEALQIARGAELIDRIYD